MTDGELVVNEKQLRFTDVVAAQIVVTNHVAKRQRCAHRRKI